MLDRKEYAIKQIHFLGAGRDAILKEVEILCTMHHENIVRYFQELALPRSASDAFGVSEDDSKESIAMSIWYSNSMNTRPDENMSAFVDTEVGLRCTSSSGAKYTQLPPVQNTASPCLIVASYKPKFHLM
ncbi:unnamed protein product [Cuscuta campestris]|uniref:Protein kinase domain-containing protein n=1 Tax=Cuscuta campestris TaxID=132261 RepID=A0A484N7N7_9ASTE|nr:unnamed protein product [Cuscuta campestris]